MPDETLTLDSNPEFYKRKFDLVLVEQIAKRVTQPATTMVTRQVLWGGRKRVRWGAAAVEVVPVIADDTAAAVAANVADLSKIDERWRTVDLINKTDWTDPSAYN